MIELDKLLEYVQKTNQTMTKENLIKELRKSIYSSVSLFMVAENIRQEK